MKNPYVDGLLCNITVMKPVHGGHVIIVNDYLVRCKGYLVVVFGVAHFFVGHIVLLGIFEYSIEPNTVFVHAALRLVMI